VPLVDSHFLIDKKKKKRTTTMSHRYVGIGENFEILAVYQQVVVQRAPLLSSKFRMTIDRGSVTIQRRRGGNCCRLVFYPKNHEDFNDLEPALVVPFDCIGKANRRLVKCEDVKKGEIVLFLKNYIDARIDGLESVKIWIGRENWETFCDGMSFLMNLQFPVWKQIDYS
jgi:hypothetical protein